MKITRKQLKKLIKESMVVEPNMTKRRLHHSVQVPPIDPIKDSSFDDETLDKLKRLRATGYEESQQADEFLMLDPEIEDTSRYFGMKDKSYTDHQMIYDKAHSSEGIVNLTPGESTQRNIQHAAYKIDTMLHDAGLGWSDGYGDLKINQLLTNINDYDHDKAIFRIRYYLNPSSYYKDKETKEDKEIKKEVDYITANHPEIIYALKKFADDLEKERKEAFKRYHEI